MAGKPLTIHDVGSLFGLDLPSPGLGRKSRSKCPFKKHARRDATFRVFRSRATGEELCLCWSCTDGDTKKTSDAIALYATLAAVDRKTAWKRLRDDGFAVPGLKEGENGPGDGGAREDKERDAYAKAQKETAHVIPVEGIRPAKVLPLDQARWARWRMRREGVLEEFAQKRGMDPEFMRAHGVIEMGGPYVGFTYVNPLTDLPCRVKVRGTKEKRFWVEPRPAEGDTSGARALDVLYLANELELTSPRNPVIILEGEPDALAVRSTGILNVVSLPDGYASAMTADLSPIHGRFSIWFLATDNDKAGQQAASVLHARSWGMMVIPIVWKRLKGDDFEVFKDANAALLGGFRREDFLRCMQAAAEERSLQVDWRVEEVKENGAAMHSAEGSALEGFEGAL
jgi:Toprim-like